MKTLKTSELIGAALDWAVAMCEGCNLQYGLTDDERYSTNPQHAWPIIDREKVGTSYDHDWIYDPTSTDPDDIADNGDRWLAEIAQPKHCGEYGPTSLVAAMRCYVASKLGDEVDVPEGLTP